MNNKLHLNVYIFVRYIKLKINNKRSTKQDCIHEIIVEHTLLIAIWYEGYLCSAPKKYYLKSLSERG